MYAARRHYVQQWDHLRPEVQHSVTVTKGGKPDAFIQPKRVSVVEEMVMYWRKAYHIHEWFVIYLQDCQDDCGTYYVSEGMLRELLAACKYVMEKSRRVDGATQLTAANDLEHANGDASRKPGTVLKDSAAVDASLPPPPTFPFDSDEYSGDYLWDIEQTHDWLVSMLDEAERGCKASIFYSSNR